MPYNSLVKIDWSTSNIQSCTCSYFDTANKTDRSCVSFISSPYKTPILKRDTTYTISCPGVLYGEAINSFSVFVDPINTKYTEQ